MATTTTTPNTTTTPTVETKPLNLTATAIAKVKEIMAQQNPVCLLYTSPSPRD